MFPWNSAAEELRARIEFTPEYEAEEIIQPAVPALNTQELENRGISDTLDALTFFEEEHALCSEHPNSLTLFTGTPSRRLRSSFEKPVVVV